MLKLVIVRYVYIHLWFSSTTVLGSTAGPGHSFANRYFVADIWRSPGPKGHQQLPLLLLLLLLGAMVAWQPLAVRIVQRIIVYNIKGYLFTVTDQFIRWNKRDVENLRKIYDCVIELCVLWRCKFLLRQPVVEWDTPESGGMVWYGMAVVFTLQLVQMEPYLRTNKIKKVCVGRIYISVLVLFTIALLMPLGRRAIAFYSSLYQ